jgi:hypothetical protein
MPCHKPAKAAAPSSSATPTWRNRIVGVVEVAPDQLLANPHNWRIHPQYQQEARRGILDEVGWVQDIILNQRTSYVLGGHLRGLLALRHGESSVPIKDVALDEAEERRCLWVFDPIAALATTDKAPFETLLRDVSTRQAAVQELLAQQAA